MSATFSQEALEKQAKQAEEKENAKQLIKNEKAFVQKKDRKPYINTNVKYDTEVFKVVATVDVFWCVAGEEFEVVEAIGQDYYRTHKPLFRCDYGNIKKKNCQLIN